VQNDRDQKCTLGYNPSHSLKWSRRKLAVYQAAVSDWHITWWR